MNKKPTSPTTKTPAASKTVVRKMTVRDLEPRKQVKAGTQGLTIGRRCR